MAVFGKKLFYSGENGCNLEKGCIRAKVALFGQTGCIRAEVVVLM